MKHRELFLIRHGETRSNREGIFRGRLDIPLSKEGQMQAQSLKNYFISRTVETVLSSPLQRARQTAMAAFPNLRVQEEKLLNNLDLGEWSGRKKTDMQKKFPAEWKKWTTSPEKLSFPGGESISAVYARAEDFLKKFQNMPFVSAAAVSHRSVIKVILAASLEMETNYFWKFHLDNGSVTRLVFCPGRGFTVTALNDTRHLPVSVTEWF